MNQPQAYTYSLPLVPPYRTQSWCPSPFYRWYNWGNDRLGNLYYMEIKLEKKGPWAMCCKGLKNVIIYQINHDRLSQAKLLHLCPSLCSPMGYTVHGILQTGIMQWVAISFSRGSSQPRDWTWVSCIAGRLFTVWAIREAQSWQLYTNHDTKAYV